MEVAAAPTPSDKLEDGNLHHSKELDAGALFVLKSKGNQFAVSHLIIAGYVLLYVMLRPSPFTC